MPSSSRGELRAIYFFPTTCPQETILWLGEPGDTLAPRGVRDRRINTVRGEQNHHALGTRWLRSLSPPGLRARRRADRVAAPSAALCRGRAGRPGRPAAV